MHVNAAKSTSAKGVETLIMGETPKEQQYNTNALFESNRDDLLDMSNEKEAAIIRAYIQNLQFTYGEYSTTMARCIQQNYMQAGRHSRGVKRQPLRVLYATNMPGVLTEIGFLSNKEEAAFLKSEKGQTAIVNALYRAVQDYSAYVLKMRGAEEPTVKEEPKPAVKEEPKPVAKEEKPKVETPQLYAPHLYEKHEEKASTTKPAAKPAPEAKPAPQTQNKPAQSKAEPKKQPQPAASTPKRYYTVQVMASKRTLALSSQEFKSYRNRVHQFESEGVYRYKYGVGEYATRSEALKALGAVRKSFPQAFVVAVENGRTVTQKK